jgi:hypothetical protein
VVDKGQSFLAFERYDENLACLTHILSLAPNYPYAIPPQSADKRKIVLQGCLGFLRYGSVIQKFRLVKATVRAILEAKRKARRSRPRDTRN